MLPLRETSDFLTICAKSINEGPLLSMTDGRALYAALHKHVNFILFCCKIVFVLLFCRKLCFAAIQALLCEEN